jgi:hypothetical protein
VGIQVAAVIVYFRFEHHNLQIWLRVLMLAGAAVGPLVQL